MGLLVYAWANAAAVVIRPVYTWQGGQPPVEAIRPLQTQGRLLAGTAAAVAAARVRPGGAGVPPPSGRPGPAAQRRAPSDGPAPAAHRRAGGDPGGGGRPHDTPGRPRRQPDGGGGRAHVLRRAPVGARRHPGICVAPAAADRPGAGAAPARRGVRPGLRRERLAGRAPVEHHPDVQTRPAGGVLLARHHDPADGAGPGPPRPPAGPGGARPGEG